MGDFRLWLENQLIEGIQVDLGAIGRDVVAQLVNGAAPTELANDNDIVDQIAIRYTQEDHPEDVFRQPVGLVVNTGLRDVGLLRGTFSFVKDQLGHPEWTRMIEPYRVDYQRLVANLYPSKHWTGKQAEISYDLQRLKSLLLHLQEMSQPRDPAEVARLSDRYRDYFSHVNMTGVDYAVGEEEIEKLREPSFATNPLSGRPYSLRTDTLVKGLAPVEGYIRDLEKALVGIANPSVPVWKRDLEGLKNRVPALARAFITFITVVVAHKLKRELGLPAVQNIYEDSVQMWLKEVAARGTLPEVIIYPESGSEANQWISKKLIEGLSKTGVPSRSLEMKKETNHHIFKADTIAALESLRAQGITSLESLYGGDASYILYLKELDQSGLISTSNELGNLIQMVVIAVPDEEGMVRVQNIRYDRFRPFFKVFDLTSNLGQVKDKVVALVDDNIDYGGTSEILLREIEKNTPKEVLIFSPLFMGGKNKGMNSAQLWGRNQS